MGVNLYNLIIDKDKNEIGKVALLMAMTNSLEGEVILKNLYKDKGYKFAITEVSGNVDNNLNSKITKNILGAAFNNKVISEDNEKDVHALLHAIIEAKSSVIGSDTLGNIKLKVAIVRKDGWIVVALFGDVYIHKFSGHSKCSLGYMNI